MFSAEPELCQRDVDLNSNITEHLVEFENKTQLNSPALQGKNATNQGVSRHT